jgi:hypothetical protein
VAVGHIAARNAFGRTDGTEPIADFWIGVLIFGFVEAETVRGDTDAKRNEKCSRNRASERGSEHEFNPIFNHEAVTDYDK